MEKYVIIRAEKLKKFGNINSSLAHNYRTRDTPNADPSRTNLNFHSVPDPKDVVKALKAVLPSQRRRDAVLCIEYLVTCSPNSFPMVSGYKAYLRDALVWLRNRHGPSNIIAYSIHFDETTPHLIVYVAPFDEAGRLNAKRFLGGKQVLSQMQTEFAKKVGQKHGLVRGIEGSVARHVTVKEWYARLNKPAKTIRIPAAAIAPRVTQARRLLPDVKETIQQVADRLNAEIQKLQRALAQKAAMADIERRKAQEMRTTARRLEAQLKDARDQARHSERRANVLEAMLNSLTPPQRAVIDRLAKRNALMQERVQRIVTGVIEGAASCVRRFILSARQALKLVGGEWWRVKWRSLERNYVQAELLETEPQSIVRVLVEHSPSRHSASEQEVERWVERVATSSASPTHVAVADGAGILDSEGVPTSARPRSTGV